MTCSYENCELNENHSGNHDLGKCIISCPIEGVPFHFMSDGTDKWWMECPISGLSSDQELLAEKNFNKYGTPYPKGMIEKHSHKITIQKSPKIYYKPYTIEWWQHLTEMAPHQAAMANMNARQSGIDAGKMVCQICGDNDAKDYVRPDYQGPELVGRLCDDCREIQRDMHGLQTVPYEES